MQEGISFERAKRGIVVVILLGIVTIGVIIALTFNKRTLKALLEIDTTFLWLAIAAMLVSWIFSALPFYILTRIIKRPISFAASAQVFLGGSFFGYITPFGSGLIPAQIYILTHENLTPGQATAMTSSRATVSSWLFVVLGLLIAIVFRESLPDSAKAGLIGITIAAAIWSFLTLFFIKQPEKAKVFVERVFLRLLARWVRGERLASMRERIYNEIDQLSSNLRDLFSSKNALGIFAVFLSEVVAWFALFSVLPLVLFGFGVKGNLAQLIFRIFLLFAVAPASPTPGGSGLVEGALSGLLLGLVAKPLIGLVVIVWRALTYYLTLLVGGIIIIRFLARTTISKETGEPVNRENSERAHGHP